MCYVMNHGDRMPCATVVYSTLAVPHRVPQAAEGEEERKSSLIEKKKKKSSTMPSGLDQRDTQLRHAETRKISQRES